MDENGNTRYECMRCGTCCRWAGYVHVSTAEVDAIAEFLGLGVTAFTTDYVELTADRRSLTLIEKPDGSCIMLGEGNLCRIHPVKPRQCRDFPNKWNFPGFEKLCSARPAVPATQAGGSDATTPERSPVP